MSPPESKIHLKNLGNGEGPWDLLVSKDSGCHLESLFTRQANRLRPFFIHFPTAFKCVVQLAG